MQKVIVSLTSYPQRIHLADSVAESLLRQKARADEIILYLSSTEFPRKEKDLPDRLAGMIGKNGFRVEWTEENLRSHKKYFYVLQNHARDIVITVDDDVIYADTMISDLLDSYRKYPQAVSARAVRIMLRAGERFAPYNEWENDPDHCAGKAGTDLCAIGYAGILYPPLCASERWFRKKEIKRLAWEQDDLWLKYNEMADGFPVAYAGPSEADTLIEEAEATALCEKNMYGGENDICNEKLREWFSGMAPEQYNRWFSALLQKEEYLFLKKKSMMERCRRSLEESGTVPVYLYGAGKRAGRILEMLCGAGLLERLTAIIVSDKKENPDRLGGITVRQIDELDRNASFAVICGVSETYKREVEEALKGYQCRYLDFPLS